MQSINKNKIKLFFVSSDPQLGSGHIKRCLGLLSFRTEDTLSYLFVAGNDEESKFLELQGVNQKRQLVLKNEQEIKQYICTHRDEIGIIIVDSYLFDLSIFCELDTELSSIKVICFDDYFHRDDYKNCLIVNSLAFNDELKQKYEQLNGKVFACGLDYQIIRKGIRELEVLPKHEGNDIKNVLVTTSGAYNQHENNLILVKVIEVLAQRYSKITFTVILADDGLDFNSQASNLIVLNRPNNFARLLQLSDLVISAGGQTIFELMYHKIPAIIYSLAYNQVMGAMMFSDIYPYVGSIKEDNFKDKLIDTFVELVEKRNFKIKDIPSLQGGERLAKDIYKLIRK